VKAGLDPNSASQSDGAGGLGAFFTPDFMIHYLAFMRRQPYYLAFFEALPILGRDGTLWDARVNSPSAGHIEAKTGTFAELNKLHRDLIIAGKGLVGYIQTARGRNMAFAIYVNNVRVPRDFKEVSEVGDALVDIATAVYEFE